MVLKPLGGPHRGGTPVRTTAFSARPLEWAAVSESLAQLGLLERDAEVAAIESVVAARPGGGRLLAIEGPPGIGKSALVAETKTLAQEAGLLVLSARGSELERSFSYGVVRQLFEPVLASLPAEEQAEVLSGAAALAGPLFDPVYFAARPAEDSSLAMLHGLYWLAANLAARQPLLLALDDLHWGDLPSLRWLTYLLPRLEGLDVSVVAGLRPEEPGEAAELVGRIVSDPLATRIRPTPLSPEAAARLVRERLSPTADDAFCAAAWEETGGNPLLLRELVHAIGVAGVVPLEANVPRLRALEARAGSRAVALRLSQLPQDATALARAVAVLGDEANLRQAAELAGLNEEAAADAAGALARADVLGPEQPLGFVHPLVRAAVYESLAPHEREEKHAQASHLLAASGAESELVAAHLLRSSPSGSGKVVTILREAARRASSRGAAESAVAYLRRALDEPPPDALRKEVLFELGWAETCVTGAPAAEHLREAHGLMDGPVPRARGALALGHQLFLLGRDDADVVFRQALDELAGADPELERRLEAGLILNGLFAPGLHREAEERLERVRGKAGDESDGAKLLLALLAYHDARAGRPAAEVVPLARKALAGVSADPFPPSLVPAAGVLMMADLDEVLGVFDDALAEAHRRGSTVAFGGVKVFRALALLMRGDLGDAEAETREALAAGEAWGSTARFATHAAAFLADSLMEQGRLDEAAAVLSGVEPGDSVSAGTRVLFLGDSMRRLRLLRGDVERGLEELLEAGRRFEEVGSRNPAFIAWRSPAALALLRLDRREEAAELVEAELELARTWGAPRALGAALRAAGLVEGGERGLVLLEEAVQVLEGSPAKLEHAKARTELGAALRRAKRRADARDHLRHAVELATICGAAALAARAETELLATGARPRRVALSGVESLTPSERRVAELAAGGPTNREIAQELFVTQRTVEVHLTSVYRKLGIDSRSQLAAALGEAASA